MGDSGICNVGGAPFLWEDGVIYNLNDLILPGSDMTLIDVDQINDRGEIACQGLANGEPHPCLLVPLELAEAEGLTNVIKDNKSSVRQSTPTRQRKFERFGRP